MLLHVHRQQLGNIGPLRDVLDILFQAGDVPVLRQLRGRATGDYGATGSDEPRCATESLLAGPPEGGGAPAIAMAGGRAAGNGAPPRHRQGCAGSRVAVASELLR